MGQRIAVVGGGVAGLTAAHLLSRAHEVELYEKSDRPGGNAFTYRTADGEEVDIAVAAFGRAGYPAFYKLLDQLGVRTRWCPSAYMSLENLDASGARGREGLYVTPWLRGLWRQRFALFGPRRAGALLRLLLVVRVLRRMLHAGELDGLTLEQALERIEPARDLTRVALLGALCLLSSQSGDEVLVAPAAFFAEKLDVHHDVLSPRAIWSVRTVRGNTRAYVSALAGPLGRRIHLESAIRTIVRGPDGVSLALENGDRETFDQVVLACNADQALALLETPTAEERRLLGAWRYKDGRIVLHRDHRSLPPWSLQQAYTLLYTECGGRFDTSVNGVLRFLPGVDRRSKLVSSQHPNYPIRPELVEYETVLRTPIFDADSCATVAALPSLNGQRRSYFCGSHFGHGLHEDAVRSAVAVAAQLGVAF